MAELNVFHYLPKKSIIHDMDGRIKLICMILFTVTACITGRTFYLTILTFVMVFALINSGLPMKKLFTEIRYFLFLIGVIIIVHSFSVPGAPISGLAVRGLTWEGLNSGLLFGWRLILIFILSTIFTGTTSLSTLKNVIEWFLQPLPFIRGTKIATMISLTFALIPLIFDQISEMREAQKARCIEGRKNPIKRVVFLLIPLLIHIFIRTDEMALAMESRCYSEVRAKAVFKTNINDWFLLIFSGLICSMAFFHLL